MSAAEEKEDKFDKLLELLWTIEDFDLDAVRKELMSTASVRHEGDQIVVSLFLSHINDLATLKRGMAANTDRADAQIRDYSERATRKVS